MPSAISGVATDSKSSVCRESALFPRPVCKTSNDLVERIVNDRIPAIFIEASVPPRSIQAVQAACAARGHPVAIGGELFSDSMGPPGTEEGTYTGMVRHNVRTLMEALQD
jgi:manganese/zinc/iron transport system substrate-binding protein